MHYVCRDRSDKLLVQKRGSMMSVGSKGNRVSRGTKSEWMKIGNISLMSINATTWIESR